MNGDIRHTIRDADMTPFQITAVVICLIINMLDGFDVLAIAFTASEISREWRLEPSDLGILFSSALAGMTLGSIFIAPVADRSGRRLVILWCLVIITVGMLLSAAARGVSELAILRGFTGLGIGGMLASLNTMVSEYSSEKRRQLTVTLLQTGYPIGATIGGIISAFLIVEFGWRSVFVFGGVVPALMIVLVYFRLPESIDYLLHRRPKDALAKVNIILAKMGRCAIDTLPETDSETEGKRARLLDIVSGPYLGRTAMIWTCFFMVMFSFYFVMSWTPKILVGEGLSVEDGISGGVLLNVGGIVGAIILGILSARYSMYRLVGAYMLLAAAAMAVFGLVGPDLVIMMLVALLVGFFIFGSIIGLYAVVPDLYGTGVRTAGTGWAIGFGRIGAIAGPYVAGLLIEAGWDKAEYFAVLALPLLVAMITVIRFGKGSRKK